MSIFDTFFGGWKTDSDRSERPERPEPVVKEKERKFPIYQVTATFKDGGEETYRATEVDHGEVYISLRDAEPGPYYRGIRLQGDGPTHIPHHQLARPLDQTQIGHWLVEWEEEYSHSWNRIRERWEKDTYPDIEVLTIEEVV